MVDVEARMNLWNSSNSAKEAAEKMGMNSPLAASLYACKMRKAGHAFKKFKPGFAKKEVAAV